MRILLIDPPFQRFIGLQKYYIPLGLLYLAGELKKKHDVMVYDADYFPEGKTLSYSEQGDNHHLYVEALQDSTHSVWLEIERVIRDFNPNVVGITLISTKFASGMRIAEICKRLGVRRVICGGPHASISPDEVLANPNVDSVIIGEGEYCFEEALTNYLVIGERITDLDSIPVPARECLYNLKQYRPVDLGMILTSRGCPFDCGFCCSGKLWNRKVVYRNVESVVAEIKQVRDTYGTRDFYIVDDSFTSTKQRVLDFCSRVKNLSITWTCLTRADLIDEELASTMRRAGCRMVKIGVESGCEKTLRLMNKRLKKSDVRRASEIFHRVGLKWFAYFIIATPDETKKDLDETIEFVKEVRPDFISFSVYTPLPGTPMYDKVGADKTSYHLHSLHNVFTEFTKLSLRDITNAITFADNYNRSQNETVHI